MTHGKLADAVLETEEKRVEKDEKEQELRAALNDRLATMVETSQSTIDCQQKMIHHQQQQISNGTLDGSIAARSCGSSASESNRKKAAPLKIKEDFTDMSALTVSDNDSGLDISVLSDNKKTALAPHASLKSSTTRRGSSKKTETLSKTARSTLAKMVHSIPARTMSRSKPPLPPSCSEMSKQGPANAKKHAGCRTPHDDTSTTSSTPRSRRGKRSASPLLSDSDAKRPARGLPAAGTMVHTHTGLTGKVHKSVAKAHSLVPVVLDGCNGIVEKFQVSNLEWED